MQRRLLIKLSGEALAFESQSNVAHTNAIVDQIVALSRKAALGIVVGGGNIFRGRSQGALLGLDEAAAHECGMLATILNARILHNLLIQRGVIATLQSAVPLPSIATDLSVIHTESALREKHPCIIYAGGSGNPFVTTDTTGVIRALTIGSTEMWKVSNVDGVYDMNPHEHKAAKRFESLSYEEALSRNLDVMDKTALTLAQENNLIIRVFSHNEPESLVLAFDNDKYGTVIKND